MEQKTILNVLLVLPETQSYLQTASMWSASIELIERFSTDKVVVPTNLMKSRMINVNEEPKKTDLDILSELILAMKSCDMVYIVKPFDQFDLVERVIHQCANEFGKEIQSPSTISLKTAKERNEMTA